MDTSKFLINWSRDNQRAMSAQEFDLLFKNEVLTNRYLLGARSFQVDDVQGVLADSEQSLSF